MSDNPQRTPDLELNLRQRHPDFQPLLDHNEIESERIRRQLSGYLDETYGFDPLQRFDVFPANQADSPIFVFIHGGYWRGLDKSSYSFTAEAFVRNGFTSCVINYRLMPQVSMASLVDDVRTALKTIQERAERYNGDPKNLVVCGHSAGGHLAVMAPLMDKELLESVTAICSVSGLFDLEPVRNSYLNDTLGLDTDTVRRFSPSFLDLSPITCPVKIVVGLSESDLFVDQSRQLVSGTNHAGNFEFLACDGLNHYEIVHKLADSDHPITHFLLEMGRKIRGS